MTTRPGRRFRVSLRILVQLGVLSVILATVSSVAFIEYSAQPIFCTNCHLMQPYYDSWASSSHNDVACIKCHYAPGIKAEAMGKLQAANQVVKYVTGTYRLKPWAEIEDAACLRSGCHEQRKLEGVLSYSGVRFDHTAHLGQLRMGKQLRCTSCHSQIVQGDHITVTPTICFLCHFKGQPEGEPISGCVSCHSSPPRVVSPAGYVVDHAQYVEDLVTCTNCHNNVTEGSGLVDEARCLNCHNEPEWIGEFENTTLLHRVHISDRNVECTQCHTPIEHRVVSLTPTFELDCASCHQGAHEAQQRLYAGTGGHGTDNLPSAMYLAKVSCRGCHDLLTTVRGHEQVQAAGEASCLSCHGIRFANVLPSWQRSMEAKLDPVSAVVTAARNALGTAPVRRRGVADSLLRLAEENVEFVRLGKGAHNITYADQLLRAALEMVEQAVDVSGMAYDPPAVDLGPPLTTNICLQCHLGIERRDVTTEPSGFDHEAHVLRGDLTCADCHTPMEDHGGLTVTSPASCNACHHAQIRPMNCARCHAGARAAPAAPVELPNGIFLHDTHQSAGLACADCHTPPTMKAEDLRCANCHEPHHQPEMNCLSCHQDGVQEKHTGLPLHMACHNCHGAAVASITRWTRQVCTTCHVDRVDHNAPTDCVMCHRTPAIGSAESVFRNPSG